MATHKAGFVNIIGSPNVGKSTLMNNLVGERLSIITSKAQTTRHRILGIVNGEDFQIVYSDTPGVLNPKYKLHEGMMGFVGSALSDADILLVVTDIFEKDFNDPNLLEKIHDIDIPVVVLVNKIDLGTQDQVVETIDMWREKLPKAKVAPISALHSFNVAELLNWIIEHLPASPPYFPKDELTDKSMRFFVSEIIREKICSTTKGSALQLRGHGRVVQGRRQHCAHPGHYRGEPRHTKRILIGHQGRALKAVVVRRAKTLRIPPKKVFLELYVKVDKNWRNDEKKLKRYGYMGS